MKREIWFYALALMLCHLLVGSVGAAWSQATAPLITLGVPLHHRDVKATKIRGVRAGQVVSVEVFGEAVKGAVGFRAALTYDPAKLKYAGFTDGPTIPGLTGLNIKDEAKGTVDVGGTSLEGAAGADKGPLGVVRFEAQAGFSGSADITLKSASVIRADGRKDSDVASTVSLADEGGVGPIALDLDVSEGKATEIRDARVGQVVPVEMFGEDVKEAIGFRATMTYDPAQLKFAGFTVGPTIPGLTGLNIKDDNKGSLEVGGVSLEGVSAVQKGSLGSLRFEVLTGFSGVADLTLKTSTVIRPDGRKDSDIPMRVSITQFGTGPAPVGPPGALTPKPGDGTGTLDLDVAAGDQKSRTLNVKPGDKVDVQVVFTAQEVAGASGFQVILTFDPKKLSVVLSQKDKNGAFVSATDLPAQVSNNTVTYGASILGGATTTAKGPLAVLTFQASSDFSGDTEILLTKLTIRVPGAVKDFTPGASVVLSRGAPGLASDFDGNGSVDFDDFFAFAAVFGKKRGDAGFDAKYDLNKNGEVDFDDFFAFAADFGKTAKSGKATASRSGVNSRASLSVGAVASGDGLTARIAASNVAQLRGYSMVVSYDPSALVFVKAERAADALLSRGGLTPLFLVREVGPGRAVIADVIAGGGTVSGDGALADLIFRRIGPDGAAAVNVDLAQIFDGVGGMDVLAAAAKEMPLACSLSQNYPNPFNPETQIAYSLPEAGRVRLTVYNLVGQVVRTLVDGAQAAGRYEVRWDGRDDAGRILASGVYLYRLEANGFSAVRRMMLVK